MARLSSERAAVEPIARVARRRGRTRRERQLVVRVRRPERDDVVVRVPAALPRRVALGVARGGGVRPQARLGPQRADLLAQLGDGALQFLELGLFPLAVPLLHLRLVRVHAPLLPARRGVFFVRTRIAQRARVVANLAHRGAAGELLARVRGGAGVRRRKVAVQAEAVVDAVHVEERRQTERPGGQQLGHRVLERFSVQQHVARIRVVRVGERHRAARENARAELITGISSPSKIWCSTSTSAGRHSGTTRAEARRAAPEVGRARGRSGRRAGAS